MSWRVTWQDIRAHVTSLLQVKIVHHVWTEETKYSFLSSETIIIFHPSIFNLACSCINTQRLLFLLFFFQVSQRWLQSSSRRESLLDGLSMSACLPRFINLPTPGYQSCVCKAAAFTFAVLTFASIPLSFHYHSFSEPCLQLIHPATCLSQFRHSTAADLATRIALNRLLDFFFFCIPVPRRPERLKYRELMEFG